MPEVQKISKNISKDSIILNAIVFPNAGGENNGGRFKSGKMKTSRMPKNNICREVLLFIMVDSDVLL